MVGATDGTGLADALRAEPALVVVLAATAPAVRAGRVPPIRALQDA